MANDISKLELLCCELAETFPKALFFFFLETVIMIKHSSFFLPVDCMNLKDRERETEYDAAGKLLA